MTSNILFLYQFRRKYFHGFIFCEKDNYRYNRAQVLPGDNILTTERTRQPLVRRARTFPARRTCRPSRRKCFQDGALAPLTVAYKSAREFSTSSSAPARRWVQTFGRKQGRTKRMNQANEPSERSKRTKQEIQEPRKERIKKTEERAKRRKKETKKWRLYPSKVTSRRLR